MYNHILQASNFYKVGLYIRLSDADGNKTFETESESIINQRSLLMDFIKQNGFVFINEYVEMIISSLIQYPAEKSAGYCS